MEQEKYGFDFELGRGKNYSINEVANMFNIIPDFKKNKPGEAQITLSNNTLAYDLLAWQPKINLQDYIKEQI
jgi:UDP-glucose 4-epimerase